MKRKRTMTKQFDPVRICWNFSKVVCRAHCNRVKNSTHVMLSLIVHSTLFTCPRKLSLHNIELCMSEEIVFSVQRYRVCQSFNVELLGIKLGYYNYGSVFVATERSADVNQNGYFLLSYTGTVCHAHSLIPWEILNLPCLPITETIYRFRVSTPGPFPDRQACRSIPPPWASRKEHVFACYIDVW